MQCENSLPLLVGHLMNDRIPNKPRIIDNNMDFAIAKFGSLRHEFFDVFRIEHVTWYGNGFPTSIVDFFSDGVGSGCVDVLYDYRSAFPGEQSGCFGSYALA